MIEDSSAHRIARRTPLAAVLAVMENRVGAVTPRKSLLGAALGAVLAEDVMAGQLPPAPIAMRDGYAVDSASLADAGPYSPIAFPVPARPIDAGEPMPADCDAVLAADAVVLRGGSIEAVAAVAAG